jgi:hypothetical protein
MRRIISALFLSLLATSTASASPRPNVTDFGPTIVCQYYSRSPEQTVVETATFDTYGYHIEALIGVVRITSRANLHIVKSAFDHCGLVLDTDNSRNVICDDHTKTNRCGPLGW